MNGSVVSGLVAILFHFAVFCTYAQPAISFGEMRVLGGSFNGADQVQGWDFTTRQDVTITHLGMYDGYWDTNQGFIQRHAVGIWTGDGALVTSAPIPAGTGAQYLENFRYVPIEPVTLEANRTYVTAAFLPAPVIDYTALWAEPRPSYLTTDPRIIFGNYRAGLSPSLSLPTSVFSGYFGGFGPNFIIADENHLPVAVAKVAPRLPHVGGNFIVARADSTASVVLDASGSSDPDGDALQFTWVANGNVLATAPIVTNRFSTGTHTVSLQVSDGVATQTVTATFVVITAVRAIDLLSVYLRNQLPDSSRPLLNALASAQQAFESGNQRQALQRLRQFAHKVRVQVRPDHIASVLLEITDAIVLAQ